MENMFILLLHRNSLANIRSQEIFLKSLANSNFFEIETFLSLSVETLKSQISFYWSNR